MAGPGFFRAVRALVCVVVVALMSSCTSSPSAAPGSSSTTSPPSKSAMSRAAVDEAGFTVTNQSITVSGGPGVAPIGTTVVLRSAGDVDMPSGVSWRPAAPGFDITLGDGVQPATPVTVSARIDPGSAAGRGLVFLTRHAGSGEWEGLPVKVRGTQATVTMTHFSGGWFGWVDDAKKTFDDAVNGYLKLRFDPPACRDKPVSIRNVKYRASVNGNGVYVCAEAVAGKPVVSVHSNSPFVWRISGAKGTVSPAAENSPVELSGAVTIATYHVLFSYLRDREAVLVPGGNSSLNLLGTGPWTLAADTDAGLGLVAIAVAGIDVYLTLAGVTLADREKLAVGECAAGILEAGRTPEAGEVTRAVIDCFGTVVKGPAAIVVAVVSSLASLLVTQIVGIVGELTRTNHLSIKVTATPDRPPATVTKFITVNRWAGPEFSSTRAEEAIDGDSCSGSELAPRSDGFRCFHRSGVYDPCFAHPSKPGEYACRLGNNDPLRIIGMPPPVYVNDGVPGSTSVYQVELVNGATCRRASGAGPPGVPGYDAWVGVCTGGPYGSDGVVWRIGDGHEQGSLFPLYSTSNRGEYVAAVEADEGRVERIPVKTAYR